MQYGLWREITDYIILFPLKWYNFLKYVLSCSIYYDNTMVINKNVLKNNKELLDDILEIFETNKIIKNISENLDMIIIYFNNTMAIKIFKYWLNMIVLRTSLDLFTYKNSNYIFQDNFTINTEEIKIMVSNDIRNKNYLYITTKEMKQYNTLIYPHNYFIFKKRILTIYHLLINQK